MRCGLTCYHKSWDIFCERGGGSKPQPAQVIPAPAAPDVGKTAGESLEAQLKYNPQLTAQQVQLQGQYGPQLAQQQYELQSQYTPLYRSLLESQYPQLKPFSDQITQQFLNPTGYSNQQQESIDAIRNREQERGLRGIREGANLGGTLYGGRREQSERDYLTQQGQAYTAQDVAFQQQQEAQRLQNLVSLLQISGLNVQQPNVPQFGQSVVPGGDNLYNAMVSNNSNFGVQPGTPGSLGFFGSFLRPFGF